jgi:hypothetical protein
MAWKSLEICISLRYLLVLDALMDGLSTAVVVFFRVKHARYVWELVSSFVSFCVLEDDVADDVKCDCSIREGSDSAISDFFF